MQVNGRVDVHRIHRRIADEVLEGGVALLHPEGIAYRIQLVLGTLANGIHLRMGMALIDGNELGTESESDDGDVEFSAHGFERMRHGLFADENRAENSFKSNAPIPQPATRNWLQPKTPERNESDPEPVPLRPTQPHTSGGSGTGPKRASQANTPTPRVQRESPPSPRAWLRAQARSRRAPAPKTHPRIHPSETPKTTQRR